MRSASIPARPQPQPQLTLRGAATVWGPRDGEEPPELRSSRSAGQSRSSGAVSTSGGRSP